MRSPRTARRLIRSWVGSAAGGRAGVGWAELAAAVGSSSVVVGLVLGKDRPDKQHVLLGVLATSVQPRQHGDRDIGGRTPGAAFLPPGEVINVRLEHIQDPSPSRIDGHRLVGT
jgi:hypothetical protein